MIEIEDTRFEQLVADGIDALPERFAPYIENVAITWDYEPTMWQRMKMRLRPHTLLFGLYEGVPKTRRGNYYSGVLPDKITIFKYPLSMIADSEEHLARLVKQTVWHEVAHHFGLSDAEIHRREAKGGSPEA